MVAALLEGKYRVPRRRLNAIARPRLAERLRAGAWSPLTLVSAPAGFGKTTALTEWLTTVGDASVAWLSLDFRDNDPALFWTYVITAIRTVVDGVGTEALGLPASPSAPSTEAALTALLNELGELPGDLVLVLDDYHFIDAPAVHEGMAFLLEHAPPQLHVVISTRVEPPLPLARMRVRGHLVEARAVDLRFTAGESAAYLNGAMGLHLSDGDVAVLEERTEGWIAALQLAALSMQGREDVSAFIAGFAGDDRYIVDYLAEEVLARQSPDVREFLFRTSILERLTGPLCDAVTGGSGGQATLLALDRANLFLVPLDDRRRWYRYHHLFAEVLQAHLLDEAPDEVSELHRRAATWFQANGDTSQAITHALTGGDVDRAAELMELAMPLMRRERREAELARWVRTLPEEVVRARPVLGMAFVGALAQVSAFGTIDERLADIERLIRPAGGAWPEQPPPGVIVVDELGYRSIPASISMYRAALALNRGDLSGTVALAREALALVPAEDDLVRAAAGALAGLAAWASGDLAGAHAAYTETVAGLARAGSVTDVLGCCIALGDIERTQGRLRDALRTYQWALELAAPSPGAERLRGTADMLVGIAGVLLERNDLTGAAERLGESARLGQHNGLPQNAYRARVVEAGLREAEGDLEAALRLLDDADRAYAGDYSPNVRPVPATRARLQLRRGELADATGWAREHEVSAADDPSYRREYEHITLARLLLARHRTEQDSTTRLDALSLLERLRTAAEDGGRGASVIEVLILQSLAHRAGGDATAAVGVLERAVVLAEPHGFVRLFLDEGAPMTALLKTLARQGVAAGYARRLVAASASTEPRSVDPPALIDPLSDREQHVLRLLDSDLDGPDIARQLFVSLNTVRTHTKNIYAKLGVTNRRAAVRRGHELDLLPGPGRN